MKLSFADLAREGELTVAGWRRFEWHPEYGNTLDEILDQRPWYEIEVGTRCICSPDDAPHAHCPRCGWRYGLLPESWAERVFDLRGALISRLSESGNAR